MLLAPGRHQRRRLTENASASRIAESNEVWHSTAIEECEESRIEFEEDGLAVAPTLVGKGKKGRTPQPENADTRGSSRGGGNNERRNGFNVDKSPIVINPPSGHVFFSSILQKCGYIIKRPATNNIMFDDLMKFRKKLGDWLVENEDEKKRIETETSKFLKALHSYLSESGNLKYAMMPTRHETELIQPSLLHCLLGIEILQPHVLKTIMPIMAEAALSTSDEDFQLITTILNDLKWLSPIVEGKKLAENLLNIVDNAVFNCQAQIVRELPYIVPIANHSQVADKLLEKFSDQGLQLNIALMDCFSCLEISETFWQNIRNTAVDQMTSAPLSDIPAYFSFVFRIESPAALSDIITTVREKVQLSSGPNDENNSRTHAYQVEILEKITFSTTHNPIIGKIWIKQIKDELNMEMESIKKIDLLMLLIFAESEKSAVDVLKILFADKKLAVELFSQLMKENLLMVKELFPVVANKIIDALLRSKDTKCTETIREITVELFLGLTRMEAQTLMGNMTSILINFPHSRDTVLAILEKLSERSPTKLLLFAPHLMGVLEYVMKYQAGQIRTLMNILAVLSQSKPENSSSRQTNHFSQEFSILLRKQLSHSNIQIRCIGVFGALAAIRKMAEQEEQHDDELLYRIKELLKLAWNTVERDEDACCIFFDELAECVNTLPVDICRPFCDTLQGKFQKLWTVDAVDKEKIQQYSKKKAVNLRPVFDANRECTEDSLIVIFENQPLEMSQLVVPAHFRVLAALVHKVKKGDLIAIDALLGCPLLLPEMGVYYEQDSISLVDYNKRVQLGQYLVLAINYFRELVIAFVNESDHELRIKIWLRLENILQMQKLLVRHFDSFPSLPFAYIAEKTIGSSRDGAGPSALQAFRMAKEGNGSKSTAKPKGKVVRKAAKRARREVPESENEDNVDEEVSIVPALAVRKVAKTNFDEEIYPRKILPYMRRFDKSVFRLLRYPLRCSEQRGVNFSDILGDLSNVSQNPARIAEVEKFPPEVLLLLLLELKHQLSDEKSKINLYSMKGFLKNICKHINTIAQVFMENEENGTVFSPDHQSSLESCLRLILILMTSYFDGTKKFDKDERDRCITRAVELLANQFETSSNDEGALNSQAEVMVSVATYLKNLVSFIKDPATALDHLKLMKTLHDVLNKNQELKMAIDEATRNYLRCEWKLPSAQVDGILKIWLDTNTSPVKVIKGLCSKLLTPDGDSEDVERKLPNTSVYKSCTEINFPVWYTAMFSGLSKYVHKNLRRRGDFEDSIRNWRTAIGIFGTLVDVSKSQQNRILVAILKNSSMFLEAFISGGVDLLPKYYSEDYQEAQKFVKSLSAPCRTIQHICEHSKKRTDLQRLKSIPVVKRVLEKLIFRVRQKMMEHGGADAFCIGSLAHRDILGQHINSQVVLDESVFISSSSDEDDVVDAPLSAMSDNDDNNQGDAMDVDSVHDNNADDSDSD